jgi:hypothetical protein
MKMRKAELITLLESGTLTKHPKLETWHALAARLDQFDVAPISFWSPNLSNDTYLPKVKAYMGDRILALRVTELQSESLPNPVPRDYVGVLAKELSAVVSNNFMSTNLPIVLPSLSSSLTPEQSRQVHAKGTMLEAAVYSVSKMPNGRQAIDELARFLLEEWRSKAFLPGDNFKGRLLELGGEFEVFKKEGYADNEPKWKGEARMGEVVEVATAGRKVDAEQKAAKKLFQRLGLS